jgi:hypothetical protein
VSGPALLPDWEQGTGAIPAITAPMRRYLEQVACVLRPGSVSGAGLALRSFAAFLTQAVPGVICLTAVTRRHTEGTITFINTFKGLPEKLSIAGGPTLSRDAGTATVAVTLRPLGDDEFEFVSATVSGEHGPHPDLGGGLFCDVLTPALT